MEHGVCVLSADEERMEWVAKYVSNTCLLSRFVVVVCFRKVVVPVL
jgi:hypothetical protein